MTNERVSLENELQTSVSYIDAKCLKAKLHNFFAKSIETVKKRHIKKLFRLGIDSQSHIDPEKVIFNLSNYILKPEEKRVLSLGLDFCIPKFKFNEMEYFLSFEKLCNLIKDLKHNINSAENIIRNISNIAYSAVNDIKCLKDVFSPVFSKADFDTLKKLKETPNLIITRPDKGNGVVVLNKDDYISKMNVILDDTAKFMKINEDWYGLILKLENKLNRFLRKIKDKLGNELYNHLFASGSSFGICYGLPKIHKLGNPMRPIISSINTFNYKLAKFLVPILKPLTLNLFSIENSERFVKEITSLKFDELPFMCSLDVKALFTNVPLKETINIIINSLFKDQHHVNHLSKQEFSTLLDMSASESIFIFNKGLYKQVDGVAMGLPLGPTFANTFLCHHEVKWMNDCPSEFKPIYYRRFVDDCFVLFKDSSHANQFLNYMNSRHPNMKFTLEQEVNNKLSFLDINIFKQGNGFITSVFRKETFTGQGINFLSYTCKLFKINTIKTLLTRAYSLCSNFNMLHEEFNFLRNYFIKNRFPRYLFDKILNDFLENKMNPLQRPHTVNKKQVYIKLPYYGNMSFVIRKQLKRLLESNYNHISFKFIFTNNFRIRNLFSYKDHIVDKLKLRVIYEYTCSNCNARYIGSAKRHFFSRIQEHLGNSIYTFRPHTNHSFWPSDLTHSNKIT